jgi:hypothetical protein
MRIPLPMHNPVFPITFKHIRVWEAHATVPVLAVIPPLPLVLSSICIRERSDAVEAVPFPLPRIHTAVRPHVRPFSHLLPIEVHRTLVARTIIRHLSKQMGMV